MRREINIETGGAGVEHREGTTFETVVIFANTGKDFSSKTTAGGVEPRDTNIVAPSFSERLRLGMVLKLGMHSVDVSAGVYGCL